MEKFDFIIGYEHRNREIESVCLLKYKLEKMGYKVMLYYINDMSVRRKANKYWTEVLLLPYCYEDKSLYRCFGASIKFKKIINLQWEQAIYRQQEEDSNSFRNPSGLCKKAVHLSWGKANYDRLIRVAGIEPKRVQLVGNITLDFLKAPLSCYYQTREELYAYYRIPKDKKVCLFIGSFKSATLDENEVEKLCLRYGEWRREHHNVAKKTMKTVIEWIVNLLQEDSELYFIYRPHPGEESSELYEIEKRQDRFRVIEDLSVKQWILAVDKIYMWMSTSVVETYFAHKNCYMVYPYTIPKEADAKIFENALSIKCYEDFKNSTKQYEEIFPIKKEIIEEYYLADESMSFLKIADVCDRVYKDDYYRIGKNELLEFYKKVQMPKSLMKKVLTRCWQNDCIYWLFWQVAKLPIHTKYFEQKRKEREGKEKLFYREYVPEKEIEEISMKIRNCLENECEIGISK